MKAEEIRKIAVGEYDPQPGHAFLKNNHEEKRLLLYREIAAQLADANEHLKCIAHPLLTVPGSTYKTLRDEFAMSVIEVVWDSSYTIAQNAAEAYRVADAMLEARGK